ncbi:endoribonuclease CG2145-like isoform X2 [Maniola jurtina]|uniref:endoribonuclease CG2145-like isoform X2 n=1 Tax=Maniola jurtina TaxID=191418 RepID=UPI001E68E22C|nr:endoribonuclease CG2145-like isoform X2 [Maniola jurtina]
MESNLRSLISSLIFLLQISSCFTKVQRYDPSSEFLLREAGGVVPSNKNDYAAQFPSLPSLKPSQSTVNNNVNSLTTTRTQLSGRRDYVAPQRSSNAPTSTTPSKSTTFLANPASSPNSPKRDYVAPQWPTLRPVGTSQKQGNAGTTPMPSTSPKRDYVAPHFPNSKQENNQHGPGKVKDLVNFYDSKSQGGSTPSRGSSYSSILQGMKGNQVPNLSTQVTQSSTKSPGNTPKPSSFSSAVTGPKNMHSGQPSMTTPATRGKPNKNQLNNRPTSPVLPSSLANTNQGTNSNIASDTELQTVSEELLRKDVNNAAKYVAVNYQEKTTSQSKDDKAPLPLLTISPEVWNITTIQLFLPLLDNYERDTLTNEHVTSQERIEENSFMDVIMATSVIRHLMNFLKDKGYVAQDPKQQRDFLKHIWFGLYSRGQGKISSSGFEHIFVSELKNGEVSGLHNWLYFSKEEVANRINYLGYLKYVEFNDKGAVIKMHFNQQGVDKPVDTMFIGTSPELEIAIYTLCYVTRVGNDCKLKLGNKDVNIVTHNFRYRSKNYIGSGYPQI